MQQKTKDKLRNLLYNEHCTGDYSEEDPFVGIYFSRLVDIIDSMFDENNEVEEEVENRDPIADTLAFLKTTLKQEDADYIISKIDERLGDMCNKPMTPENIREFFYNN